MSALTVLRGQEHKTSPLIIHVSGQSGSGKTTLGERIQKRFPRIVVYDTDFFIQPDTQEGKRLIEMEKGPEYLYTLEWQSILRSKFKNFIEMNERAPVIVFVGLLDNFGPEDGSIFELRQATHLFYIDIKLDQLLKQYYIRAMESASDPQYWKDVASDKYEIRGSRNIRENASKLLKWHTDHGYDVMSADKIEDVIGKLVRSTRTTCQ